MTALQRKHRTEKYLKSLDIPVLESLPMIEEESEVKIRTAIEIAQRILILTYLNFYAEEPSEKEDVIEFLKADNLWEHVTEKEKEIFEGELSDKDKINISWRTEGIWLLLWSINLIDKIDLPIDEARVSDILECLPDLMENTSEFVSKGKLRTVEEILDLSDLTYRIHWACRQEDLKSSNSLNFNSSIVYERHYAINWLTCYEENWDDITTDT